MLRADRPESRTTYPSGHRADADVCELLHPIPDERGGQPAGGIAPVCAEERYAGAADLIGGQLADLRRKVYVLSAHGRGIEAGGEAGGVCEVGK